MSGVGGFLRVRVFGYDWISALADFFVLGLFISDGKSGFCASRALPGSPTLPHLQPSGIFFGQ